MFVCVVSVANRRCVCLGVICAAVTGSGWFDSFRGALLPHAAPQRFAVHTSSLRNVRLADGPCIPVWMYPRYYSTFWKVLVSVTKLMAYASSVVL